MSSLRHSLGVTSLFLGLLAACAEQPHSAPPSVPPSVPPPGPHLLEGHWESAGKAGPITMTIEGDALYYYERDDFQYDATVRFVPDTDPPEFCSTIRDTPRTTDSVGEVVTAIYELTDGVLEIAVIDKTEGEPGSFDDAISRYRFEKAEPPE